MPYDTFANIVTSVVLISLHPANVTVQVRELASVTCHRWCAPIMGAL